MCLTSRRLRLPGPVPGSVLEGLPVAVGRQWQGNPMGVPESPRVPDATDEQEEGTEHQHTREHGRVSYAYSIIGSAIVTLARNFTTADWRRQNSGPALEDAGPGEVEGGIGKEMGGLLFPLILVLRITSIYCPEG